SAAVLLSSSLSPSSTNNQQSLTTSDNVLQQIASPNSIPIIIPSYTIQLNSTSVTVSSLGHVLNKGYPKKYPATSMS
ncbi:unnamed protein product, partial [Rotaria magnacalcarata]